MNILTKALALSILSLLMVSCGNNSKRVNTPDQSQVVNDKDKTLAMARRSLSNVLDKIIALPFKLVSWQLMLPLVFGPIRDLKQEQVIKLLGLLVQK
jgi:hypothetical protein